MSRCIEPVEMVRREWRIETRELEIGTAEGGDAVPVFVMLLRANRLALSGGLSRAKPISKPEVEAAVSVAIF